MSLCIISSGLVFRLTDLNDVLRTTKLAQKNTYTPDSAKANMVKHVGSSSKFDSKAKGKCKKNNDKKGKGKAKYLTPKARIRVNPRQAYMVNNNMDMIAMVFDVIAMISEVNLRFARISVGGVNKVWYCLVFESDKFVISKNQMYVGKGYALNGDKINKRMKQEGLKCKAGILQKMEDFEDSKRSS
ncbi:hypothetical protein Tco_1106789 [Tanacetum coccineum]